MLKLVNKQGALIQVSEAFERLKNQFLSESVETLAYIGEEFVKEARLSLNVNKSAFPKGSFQDQTANLRSSIGYYVLFNEKVVKYNLEAPVEAQSFVSALLRRGHRKGVSLVCIAGMEYASYVESKGYNVISSQKNVAFIELEADLKEVARKYGIILR